jgi:hypothetical protein
VGVLLVPRCRRNASRGPRQIIDRAQNDHNTALEIHSLEPFWRLQTCRPLREDTAVLGAEVYLLGDLTPTTYSDDDLSLYTKREYTAIFGAEVYLLGGSNPTTYGEDDLSLDTKREDTALLGAEVYLLGDLTQRPTAKMTSLWIQNVRTQPY